MLYILPPPSAPSPPSPWESIVMCSGQNKLTENRSFKKFGLRPLGRSKTCGRYRINKKDSGGIEEEDNTTKTCKSLSECYFAGKGTALMLGSTERLRSMDCRRSSDVSNEDPSGPPSGNSGSDIQQHLQSMFYLLRPEETLKMAVKLESLRAGRTRYLVVVSRPSIYRVSNDEPTSLPMANITNTSAATSQQPPPTTTLSTQQQNAQRSTISSSMTKSSSSIHTTTPSPSHLVSSMSMSLNVSPTTASKSQKQPQQQYQQQQQCSCQVATANVVDNNTNDNDYNKNINNELSISSNNKLMDNNLNNCDKKLIITQNMSCAKCEKLTTASPLYNNNLHQHNDKFTIKSDNSSDSICSNETEECCLLGIDCNEKTTVGLVLKVLADTSIRLDGDGGFSVNVCARQHIFKPVSVQAMWSALQTLHKVSSKASEHNFFAGGTSHEWVSYYESRIESDRSCLNEWHAMDSLESRRPPSPDIARNKPTERRETERTIRTALKEIMMSVDLDEVTSKYIRGRLEKQLDMDLGEYKSFIDEEMLIILGQMDAPTEIFEHVYLGSEWNASNLEELQRNGVRHILNVTREIDNFFPGMFDYFNVRVYDDEKTDLLKHWDNTFKYISRAKMEGSKVLVHCKMGISRSASVVIAYAMKAHNWNFEQALRHVKDKRTCIKPNKSFLTQLETYQGILDAMKNKEKLQRSKSETNLKSTKDSRFAPTPLIQMQLGLLSAGGAAGASDGGAYKSMTRPTSRETKKTGRKRPKSWSPDIRRTQTCKVAVAAKPLSQSLEYLGSAMVRSGDKESKTVLMPCKNGQNYSVSQNQIVHLQENKSSPSLTTIVPSVKLIVSELESNERKTKDNKDDRRLLNNLNLSCEQSNNNNNINNNNNCNVISASILASNAHVGGEQAAGETKEIWDPGDIGDTQPEIPLNQTVWTSSAQIIHESLNPPVGNGPKNEHTKADVVTLRPVELVKTSPHTRSGVVPPNQPALAVHPIPAVADLRSSSSSSIDPNVSRQSSWSSVDSAVVLVDSRDMPSRHSSWGSGDNRMAPSRNSSWGSYDIRNFKQSPLNTTTTYTANVITLPPNSRIVDSSQQQQLPQQPPHPEIEDKYKSIPPIVAALPDDGQTGIFPYDKDDIPWHVGTVKRTKQRIEQRNQTMSAMDNLDTIQRNLKLFETCEPHHKPPHHCRTVQSRCNSEEVLADSTNLASKTYSRLSASAPEPFSLMQFIGGEGCCCKQSQQQQHRGHFKSQFVVGDVINLQMCPQGIKRKTETGQLSGMVKNLKMNFEAKAIESTSSSGESISGSGTLKKGRSLPSSPVAMHPEVIGTPPLVRGSTVDSSTRVNKTDCVEGVENTQLEDINVRCLVDKYEITKMRSNSMNAKKSSNVTRQRPRSVFETKFASNTLPTSHHTKPLMINHATVILKHDRDRPPVPPPTVRNTIQIPIGGSGVGGLVGGAAANKTTLSCKKGVQQHGKTHPLARLGNLTTKQRLNAAYNTM